MRTQCASFPCYAPVFRAARYPVVRLTYQLFDVLVMAGLIVLTLGFISLSERGRCRLRQHQFKIENRAYGNLNPGVPLTV